MKRAREDDFQLPAAKKFKIAPNAFSHDMIRSVCSFVANDTILSCRLVSKQWNASLNETDFWPNYYATSFKIAQMSSELVEKNLCFETFASRKELIDSRYYMSQVFSNSIKQQVVPTFNDTTIAQRLLKQIKMECKLANKQLKLDKVINNLRKEHEFLRLHSIFVTSYENYFNGSHGNYDEYRVQAILVMFGLDGTSYEWQYENHGGDSVDSSERCDYLQCNGINVVGSKHWEAFEKELVPLCSKMWNINWTPQQCVALMKQIFNGVVNSCELSYDEDEARQEIEVRNAEPGENDEYE